MATQSQIRAAILARLDTVSGIGNTQSSRRTAQTYAQLEAAFTATIGGQKMIRGWSIAWESGELNEDGWKGEQKRMTGLETWVVRGYMSANDAQETDITWSMLIESVMSALVTFAGSLVPHSSHSTVVLRQNVFALFDVPGIGSQAIVHMAEIGLQYLNERVV